MAGALVPDDLWTAIASLLPPEPPTPRGGGSRLSDRVALTGILFVLKPGLPWEMLLAKVDCGAGMICRRRLRDWYEAGVRAALHQGLLERLFAAGQLDWHRAALDSTFAQSRRGCGYRAKSDVSRRAGKQAPHRSRCQGHAIRRADRTRQPTRQPRADADVGCQPFDDEPKA